MLPEPERVSVPAPSFVSVPVLVVMFPLTVVLPTPPIVRFCVLVMPPESVRVSESELIREAAARVIVPA